MLEFLLMSRQNRKIHSSRSHPFHCESDHCLCSFFLAREILNTPSLISQIVKEGEVDEKQMARIYTDKPGALWHIFHQQDVDKIRKFIKKVLYS